LVGTAFAAVENSAAAARPDTVVSKGNFEIWRIQSFFKQ